MSDVKKFGKAGILSYVLVELAFWAVAGPVAYASYRVADGTWLDLSDPIDKAKLLGGGTLFVNLVRFLVPLRLGAALAIAPKLQKLMDDQE